MICKTKVISNLSHPRALRIPACNSARRPDINMSEYLTSRFHRSISMLGDVQHHRPYILLPEKYAPTATPLIRRSGAATRALTKWCAMRADCICYMINGMSSASRPSLRWTTGPQTRVAPTASMMDRSAAIAGRARRQRGGATRQASRCATRVVCMRASAASLAPLALRNDKILLWGYLFLCLCIIRP
jgi:hypothetical protein